MFFMITNNEEIASELLENGATLMSKDNGIYRFLYSEELYNTCSNKEQLFVDNKLYL